MHKEEFVKQYNDLIDLGMSHYDFARVATLMKLANKKRCYMCSVEFTDTIRNPLSDELRKTHFVPICALSLFSPEFLVHMKTTHGLEPNDIDKNLQSIGLLTEEEYQSAIA